MYIWRCDVGSSGWDPTVTINKPEMLDGFNHGAMKFYNHTHYNSHTPKFLKYQMYIWINIVFFVTDEQTDNVWRWADGGSLGFANWNASWREETVDRMDCGFVPTAG